MQECIGRKVEQGIGECAGIRRCIAVLILFDIFGIIGHTHSVHLYMYLHLVYRGRSPGFFGYYIQSYTFRGFIAVLFPCGGNPG